MGFVLRSPNKDWGHHDITKHLECEAKHFPLHLVISTCSRQPSLKLLSAGELSTELRPICGCIIEPAFFARLVFSP